MRHLLACVMVICAVPEFAAAQPAPTLSLRQVIADQRCKTTGLPREAANAVVISYGVLHDADDCVIAFVRDLDRSGAPLEIISSRTPSHNWIYAKLPLVDSDRSPIASIQLEGDLILVSLQYTPDEYAIPIIGAGLKQVGLIHGTFVRTWPNGLIEYVPRQAHFGPHDVRISVFDPVSAADREIYPVSPCDPCTIETRALSPLHFNWQTNAVAFAVEWSDENDKRVQVMVTCEGLTSLRSIRCRESPLEAWQGARRELDMRELIAFAASQPRFR